MRVLITGGMGFIGLNLAKALLGKATKIILMDNLSAQIHGVIPHLDDPVLKNENVSLVRGDVTNAADLASVISEVDAIVHLAAETGTGQSMYQIAHYNNVNSQGTALLLDALQKLPNSVKKIVLASSRSVYGEGAFSCSACSPAVLRYPNPRSREALASHNWDFECPDCNEAMLPVATPENGLVNPASIYAATKFAQEELVRIGAQALGISSVILRFQNVYGEGQSLNNPYTGILSIFSTRIRQGKSLPIFEDGLESRDFVHVSDIADAISLSLFTETGTHDVFNVGLGVPVSVMDIASKLVSLLNGIVAPHVTAEYRVGDIRHCYADLTHIRSVLGFQPKVDIDEGMKRFVEWVLTQEVPVDRLDEASAELRRMKLMS